VFLAKSPVVDNYDLSSLEKITSGAAPLAKDTEDQCLRRLKLNEIKQGMCFIVGQFCCNVVIS